MIAPEWRGSGRVVFMPTTFLEESNRPVLDSERHCTVILNHPGSPRVATPSPFAAMNVL